MLGAGGGAGAYVLSALSWLISSISCLCISMLAVSCCCIFILSSWLFRSLSSISAYVVSPRYH